MFWEIGSTKDGQDVLTNPQAQNSYSYAGNNPIIQKDSNGRQYIDINGSATGLYYGVPIGPTVGALVNHNGDSYLYVGLTVTNAPGGSAAVLYTPKGSPSEGLSVSASGFYKGGGGQVSFPPAEGTDEPYSTSYGAGTQGVSISVTLTFRLDPLRHETTAVTSNKDLNDKIKYTSIINSSESVFKSTLDSMNRRTENGNYLNGATKNQNTEASNQKNINETSEKSIPVAN